MWQDKDHIPEAKNRRKINAGLIMVFMMVVGFISGVGGVIIGKSDLSCPKPSTSSEQRDKDEKEQKRQQTLHNWSIEEVCIGGQLFILTREEGARQVYDDHGWVECGEH